MGNQQMETIKNEDIKPKACCGKVSLYIDDKNVEPSDITCAICFQIYKSPRIMKCKYFFILFRHTFCQPCIQDWGKCRTTSCPYCRTELKKIKSNYGKIDRKTESKIQKTKLKCRGCNWTGNPYQFILSFQQNPTLDENELPCEKIHDEAEIEEERIITNQDCEQKKQFIHDFEQKQEFTPTKQSLDQIFSPDHMKVMKLIQNDSIFINDQVNDPPVYLDMEKQLMKSRQKTWEDLLFDDEDLMF